MERSICRPAAVESLTGTPGAAQLLVKIVRDTAPSAPVPLSSAGISRSQAASMKSTSAALKKRYVGRSATDMSGVAVPAALAAFSLAGSVPCAAPSTAEVGSTEAAPTEVTNGGSQSAFASSASIAATSRGSSAATSGAKRATTSPLRLSKNFSKFQSTSAGSPAAIP
jgi:hypothetical protein